MSWDLSNPSGDVDGYRVTYNTESGDTTYHYCFTNWTTTEGSYCNENVTNLYPCAAYDITVQPLDNRVSIGAPATDTSYTLPGKLRK